MTRHDLDALTSDQLRAREALKSLAEAPPVPEFRERLARQFVSGEFSTPAGRALGARGRGARGALRGALEWIQSGPAALRWVAAPVAVAAIVLAVGALNRGPQWRVTVASGDGVAVVDGRPIPMNHLEDLSRRIKPGARVRTPAGATLQIASARNMAIQLTAGTDATVPRPPGRWFSRQVSAEVKTGIVRISTGSGFRGAMLRITTPEAQVEVSGTTLAVICEAEGTCVCVLEGRVRVGELGGPLAEVSEGMRRFVFNSARESEVAEMRESERSSLGDFLRINETLLEPSDR